MIKKNDQYFVRIELDKGRLCCKFQLMFYSVFILFWANIVDIKTRAIAYIDF